jgi:hypothetical protein
MLMQNSQHAVNDPTRKGLSVKIFFATSAIGWLRVQVIHRTISTGMNKSPETENSCGLAQPLADQARSIQSVAVRRDARAT